jgi:hypothetical protein
VRGGGRAAHLHSGAEVSECERRVAGDLENDGMYAVAELTEDAGLVVLIGRIARWQALAIVAVLDPPFQE